MTGIKVTLTESEMLEAAIAGVYRSVEDRAAGRKEAHGQETLGYDRSILGCFGERAVAKEFNLYWPGKGVFGERDVGPFEVRTRSLHSYDLIVRKKNKDEDMYVLVTGKGPDFWIRGWKFGDESKQKKWIRTHANRPPAYFVPVEELEDPMELYDLAHA
jgi:hypothetical protein